MKSNNGHIFTLTAKPVYRILLLAGFAVSLIVLLALQSRYYRSTYGPEDAMKFEREIQSKESRVEEIFSRLTAEMATTEPMDLLTESSDDLQKLAQQEGIYIFYYQNGRLMYWADHSVPIRSPRVHRTTAPLYETRNSTYLKIRQEVEDDLFMALILIKTTYPYENRYLESGYHPDFDLSPDIPVSRQPAPGWSDIKSKNGEYLFSIELGNRLKENHLNVSLSLVIFMVGILALFWYLALRTDAAKHRRERTLWLTISALSMVSISIIIIFFELPNILFSSQFFQPEIFASLNFPSLGHLWVMIMLILMITLLFYWFFDRSRSFSLRFNFGFGYLLIFLASLWFVFTHHVISSLVLDSTISFEPYKLNNLSVFTFIGLLIILMGYTVFCVLIDRAVTLLLIQRRRKGYVPVVLIAIAVHIPFFFINSWHLEWITTIFMLAIIASLIFIRSGRSKLKFSRFFPTILILAIFTTVDLQLHTSEKLNSQKDIELAKLSSEHDFVAEMLFADLSRELRTDSLLIGRLSYQIIDIDLMFEYLQRTYFSGYWTKYDLQITICRPADSVLIEEPEMQWYPCFQFFEELVGTEGVLVNNSDFYFLNNLNGRISYLGKIPYTIREDEITLFIELDSKIISEELGYPSLLMREQQEQNLQFSSAKYNRGKLITSRGNYNYRLTPDSYTRFENTFESVRRDGYDHTIFNVDPDNTVIVSVPVVSFIDRLISFSYLFAIIFAIFSVSYLLVSASHIRATVTWDFKNKIQYSVIGILFLTFLVICAGTIYFIIQQYRMKHQDNLENTMRSLYIELVHKVEFEEDLRNWSSESYYNLDELLRKFSNVFYTDINMYDENGMLLATSRGEIFEQDLLSLRMNREAFNKLSQENYSAYIHTEHIGKMSYQSAYVPLLNSDNQFLAYLNLPYVTEPEILAQEVTNLVVAILNTYVILLLLILFLSVFLADRITQPLRFIQSRIAQLSLSKTNEKITYKGRDEIAGLVDEYNYMVEELVKSAELLAQSERESAWREMAKQIAHEIKNPLTPMKLNVQHMLRMITEEGENLEEQVEKVSHSLIEQIDSLTSIANEFSDFAKMPRAKNRQIDLAEKLQNIVTLFENSEGVQIDLDLAGLKDLKTYGDPEQFQRVIINLVKNGIQAIPDKREKKIRIALERAPEETAIIAVTDNGKGIPEEIQDRLFQPNFTTKSAGMGMGLAIASSIIKSMGGNIWYSTRANEGTTFFIKVPVVE